MKNNKKDSGLCGDEDSDLCWDEDSGLCGNYELVLWGLPEGESDRFFEQVLYTKCKTLECIESIIKIAKRDGWHSFRVQRIDFDKPFGLFMDITKLIRNEEE